jgi:CDI immunity proteins
MAHTDESLTRLENHDWGDAPPDATGLMASVHRLRHTPVGDLRPDDLRVLIGQQVGVDVLVPLALPLLRADPLLEGAHYPGDLLAAVLRLPASYWAAHPARRAEVEQLLATIEPGRTEVRAEIAAFLAGRS